jgi:DNA polymerase III epsilon subunit-like protein
MKILWFDCETTGLDPKLNDIVTLSMIIDIDGKIVDRLDLKMQPKNWDAISPEALKINGLTIEQLKTFEAPSVAHAKIKAFFGKYVDQFKKNKTIDDKLIPAGYNVLFDIQFLAELFVKQGDKYFGAWVDYHKLDIASIVLFLKMHNVLDIPGFKLVEVAKALGIEFAAHDAAADIETTRTVALRLLEKIKVIS